MTATREGIFCCSYISTAPLLAQQVKARTDLGDSSATVAGAVMAGSLAALLTHPADTFKTRLQGDLFAVEGSAKPPVNVSIRAAVAVRSTTNLPLLVVSAPFLKQIACDFWVFFEKLCV